MPGEYYSHSNYPTTGAAPSSAAMRAELELVEAGLDKCAPLAGNGGKIVAINAGGTAQEAITTTGTGDGVRATSPTLVTPILGTPTSGDATNLVNTIAPQTNAATSKATPVDADVIPIADSAASFGLKKLTWANLKTTLAALTSTWGISTTGNAATATTATNVAAGSSDAIKAANLVSLSAPFNTITAKAANYTVVAADRGVVFDCTSTFTLSLTAAATLGTAFAFTVKNSGTGTITIDPNAAELIDGVATVSLFPNQSCTIICNGTAFKTISLAGTLIAYTRHTASGTHTKNLLTNKQFVRVKAGGGGGANAVAATNSGGGGGEGEERTYLDLAPTATSSITVGASGSNSTYVGSITVTANGGTAASGSAGGAGGTGGTGGSGRDGRIGGNGVATTANATGGVGGGGVGGGNVATDGTGATVGKTAPANSGFGAGGGALGLSAQTGGGGSTGCVEIWEYA